MRKLFLFTLFSLTFSISTIFAQTEKDMENLISDIVEQNKKGHSKDHVEKMMEYFRPDALVNVSRISVDNKRYHHVLRKGDYKAIFVNQYNQNVHRESNIKFYTSKVQGSVGVCTFSLQYKLMNDGNGKVLSKGTEYITATFIAKGGKWYVLELNVTDIEEEQFQGKCSCEVYSNPNTGSVIAKVGAPRGDRFQSENNNLYSKNIKGETYYMVKGIIFQWVDKKEIWAVDSSYKKVEKLGAAKNKEEAMKVLMMYLYKDECSEMQMIF
ncbi:hypothetical protein [Flammeovirga aprica]|uniref:SnoaL-like domain-containing protein n=1 Tax=Flammeovirga aprica JL-4 TaxID=694437 RepID=A0A7X9RZ88_9BACT|nr:hypothetical protein [Flammeovirga aprica]NME71364.1 hypothetical protein [Flammeovirga aprica JL-4]